MSERKRYSPEVKERAVRLFFEQERSYPSRWKAMTSIAGKFGCNPETLRSWVQKAELAKGRLPGLPPGEQQRIKELEREVRELKRANEILRKASAFFAQAELDRRPK